MFKAIGFDVGHTLINYNWSALYRPALEQTVLNCGISLSENMAAAAIEILLKYNTQVNYREHEITSDTIFSEILAQWHISVDLDTIKRAFTPFFKQTHSPIPMRQTP